LFDLTATLIYTTTACLVLPFVVIFAAACLVMTFVDAGDIVGPRDIALK